MKVNTYIDHSHKDEHVDIYAQTHNQMVDAIIHAATTVTGIATLCGKKMIRLTASQSKRFSTSVQNSANYSPIQSRTAFISKRACISLKPNFQISSSEYLNLKSSICIISASSA